MIRRILNLPQTIFLKRFLERYKIQVIREKSEYDNIFYCCVQKTASQWLRGVLSDPVVFKYTGLKVHPYRLLGLRVMKKKFITKILHETTDYF